MSQSKVSIRKIEDTIDEILKKREFQGDNENKPISKMISRLWDSIKEWVENLFFKENQTELHLRTDRFGPVVQNGLKIVLIVLAAVCLFFIIRLAVKKLYLQGKPKRNRELGVSDFLDDPQKAFGKVNAMIAKNEYTEAMRYLFISVLFKLHHMKVIKIEKWKTNRMYIQEIQSGKKDLADSMKHFTDLFNECCYGGKTVGEEQIRLWMDFYRELEVGEA